MDLQSLNLEDRNEEVEKVLVKEFLVVDLGCRAGQMTKITSQKFVFFFSIKDIWNLLVYLINTNCYAV